MMPVRPILLAAMALLAAACSSGRPATTTPAPRPAERPPAEGPARVTLVMGYNAIATVERRDSVILALPSGGRQVQQLSRRLRFALSVNDRGEARVRLDSISFRPSASGSEREAIGTTWTGRVTADGLTAIRSDRQSTLIAELSQMVRDLFPAIPRGGVTTGDGWADTTRAQRQVEIFEATDDRVAAWSVGRRSQRSGLLVLPVTAAESYTQLGQGEQAGREMRMSAEGRRTSTYHLTMGGRIDGIVQVDSATRLITIPATRQAVPTTQVARTRVEIRYR